jgi:glycosyltransferase involved in cell wall biosynthesis
MANPETADYKAVIVVRSPVRILHVAPYSADAWAYGGIPRLMGALTRGLARRGHQVTVCTTDACDATSRLPIGVRPGSDPGLTLRVFPNVSNVLAYHLQLFLPLGLGAFLKEHASAFDVAHLHACRNVPGAIAASHLRRAGVPYVLAPNGTAPIIERRRLAKRAFDLLAGRRVLEGAARVLAVSNAEHRELEALGIPRHAIRLIPNPVDLDEFRAPLERGRFRKRLGLGTESFVLFLGQLTPRKRVDVLVRAFAQLRRPGARLVIAGNDMGTGAALRSLVRTLEIDRQTVYTGLLRAEERLEALADADIVVYPSEHEIFGLVPLESLLAGTPVIVSNDSGCGEIVGEVGGGLVLPPGDVDALRLAIDRVLLEPSRWRAAAADAGRRVRNAYGADVVCEQLERVYGEMVATA